MSDWPDDEAVERAAKGIAGAAWNTTTRMGARARWREDAYAALEAAGPHVVERERCQAQSREGSVCEREHRHEGCHEQFVDGDSRRWWGDWSDSTFRQMAESVEMVDAGESSEDWAYTTEKASPNDPIVHGARWKRERDEALAEVRELRQINANMAVDFLKAIPTASSVGSARRAVVKAGREYSKLLGIEQAAREALREVERLRRVDWEVDSVDAALDPLRAALKEGSEDD